MENLDTGQNFEFMLVVRTTERIKKLFLDASNKMGYSVPACILFSAISNAVAVMGFEPDDFDEEKIEIIFNVLKKEI